MNKNPDNSYFSFFKSIAEQERSEVVICDPTHKILYMNPVAVENCKRMGRENLVGQSLLECHNAESGRIIQKVVEWFAQDESHNLVYLYHNEKFNKDVYMIALREDGKLIGYYEKHEFRNLETMKQYDLW